MQAPDRLPSKYANLTRKRLQRALTPPSECRPAPSSLPLCADHRDAARLRVRAKSSHSGGIEPAGYEASQGILSTAYLKDPKDSEWKNDASMNEWRTFMTKWYPEGDLDDSATVFGYGVAKGLEQVLRQCGDTLTRENVMKQAANLDFEIGIYLPGTRIKTGPDDFAPIEQLQMMRFKGESWERFGPVMSGAKGS